MSDYTPTTADVRHRYVYYLASEKAPVARADEFDRWFDQMIREAKAEAWDEGLRLMTGQTKAGDRVAELNPYRKGSVSA